MCKSPGKRRENVSTARRDRARLAGRTVRTVLCEAGWDKIFEIDLGLSMRFHLRLSDISPAPREMPFGTTKKRECDPTAPSSPGETASLNEHEKRIPTIFRQRSPNFTRNYDYRTAISIIIRHNQIARVCVHVYIISLNIR